MSINIPTGKTLEQHIHDCPEQERMRIFQQENYEKGMYNDSKDKRLFARIEAVAIKMGYR